MDESEQVIESPHALEPISDEMLRHHVGGELSASDWAKMNLEVDEHTKESDSDPDHGNTVSKEAEEARGEGNTSRKNNGTVGKVKGARQGPAEAQAQDAPTTRVSNSLRPCNKLIADEVLQVHDTRSRRAVQNAASSKARIPPSTLRMMR